MLHQQKDSTRLLQRLEHTAIVLYHIHCFWGVLMGILERDLNLFISGLLTIVLLRYSRLIVSWTDMCQVPSAIGISLYKFELGFMEILLCTHFLYSVTKCAEVIFCHNQSNVPILMWVTMRKRKRGVQQLASSVSFLCKKWQLINLTGFCADRILLYLWDDITHCFVFNIA